MDGAAYAVARPNREDSKDTQSIRWRASLSLLKLEEEISKTPPTNFPRFWIVDCQVIILVGR